MAFGCASEGTQAPKPAPKAAQAKTPSKEQKTKITATNTSRVSQAPGAVAPSLRDPSKAVLRAPGKFVVKLDTTKGPIFLKVDRSWAPKGVDRFYNLVKAG